MNGSDESSRLSGEKFPRKQTNPRICVVSTDNSNSSVIGDRKKSSDNGLAVTASFNSDSNSLMMQIKDGNVRRFGGLEVDDDDDDDDEDEEEEDEEEEEKGEKELKGYSRSEVTVIDTSFGQYWKSEKLVFRKKNVWKVREKKGKLRSFGRKKRKGGNDLSWGVVGLEKKAKVSASQEANGGDQSVRPSSDEVRVRVFFLVQTCDLGSS